MYGRDEKCIQHFLESLKVKDLGYWWEANINMELREIDHECVNWMGFGLCALVNIAEYGEFYDYLSDCQLVRGWLQKVH